MDDRELLLRLATGVQSGDALAREAGLTRAAVWKRIQGLRAAGVGIQAAAGRGYALERPLDLLDPAGIRAGLPAGVAERLARLDIVWQVDSTNSELLRRSEPPGARAEVLLAERQSAGRGRLGRHWTSPLGAQVCMSVRRGFGGGLSRLGGLSLVAGVAICEALRGLGYPAIGLKWPNDLVADGRKLVGLLVEGGGEHAGPVRAVIGVGINVDLPAAAGEGIGQPWTDLATLAGGHAPTRDAVAAAVLAALLPALDLFDEAGLEPFLPRYAALDVLQGQRVTVLGRDVFDGLALGLAHDGGLRVRLDDGGERTVHAGEVSVRRQ